jgi:hypothetical protein
VFHTGIEHDIESIKVGRYKRVTVAGFLVKHYNLALVPNTLRAFGADLDDFLQIPKFRSENDPMRLGYVDLLQSFLEKRLGRTLGNW